MVLVTRRDMVPGYLAVQPAHALAEFATTFPKIFRNWHQKHKNLVIVSVANELALQDLFKRAQEAQIKSVIFREPDIGNEATAVALEPSSESYRLTSSLPLALKEFREDLRQTVGGI